MRMPAAVDGGALYFSPETNPSAARCRLSSIGASVDAGGLGSRRDEQRATYPPKEINMNWERVEGNWKQVKGRLKEQWGKLTDDDLDVIAGKRDQLAGKIQERYGLARDVADSQISDWERDAKDDDWFVDADRRV
jgi:uncharacterized protein YjbJ (UPF0337 family)